MAADDIPFDRSFDLPPDTVEEVRPGLRRIMCNNPGPMTFKGTDVVSTIAAFVKEYGITHLLIGRSQRPWYRRWFGQSILDRLIRAVPEVDVIVADGKED